MTSVSEGRIRGIDSAKGRSRATAGRRGSVMPTPAIAYPPTVSLPAQRADALGARTHDHAQFNVPAAARLVKDIVWLAVVSMTLASIALVVGLIDIFVTADLVPLVLGAGLASITFSVLGLTDRLSGRS